MKKYEIKKIMSALLVICMMLTLLVQVGCSSKTPAESSPESTPVASPAESPSESSPEESPAESSPAESSEGGDASTPAESSGEPTPPESTPDITEVYNITYDLDGGINADENPTEYTYLSSDITLYVPIKSGYAFAGWTGTGLNAATERVTISSGSTGDRAYKATWKEITYIYAEKKDDYDPIKDQISSLQNSNNGIAVNPDGTPISSKPDSYDIKGNGIYIIKTAYTTIAVDGVMDNAYTYGLHYELDLPENKERYGKEGDTTFDVYMTLTQDGKMHVFVEVFDKDIVINDDQWEYKWWHCDVWQMYVDFGNDKINNEKLWSFAAEPTKKYLQDNPENWIVVMTENGFNVEFEFDNNGKPFKYGDELGFAFFYNDSWDYVSTAKYGRSNTRNSSVLVPASGKYTGPDPSTQDGLFVTSYPLDYSEEINSENVKPEKTGNMFKDIASGAASVVVVYGANSSAHTEINAEMLAQALADFGISVHVVREDKVKIKNYDYVVYVNGANDKDSTAMINGFHYAEYGVKVADGKILSVGWQAKANTNVTEMIKAIFGYAVSGGDTAIIGTYTEELPGIPGANVPKVEGAQWITDSGDDAYVVHKLDTNLAFYESYKKLVEAAGYTFYTENVIASVNKNATYYNDDTVINIFYSDAAKDKDLRVTIEPMYNTNLPMLKAEEYESKTQSSVTLLNPNNLTMIVKLANGEFIIIDSGNRHTDNYIYEELMKQHKSNSKIVIAAWIFTHFHQDHQGGFIDFTLNETYMKKVQIKSIILNFPEKQVLDTASSADQVNLGIWPTCIQKCIDQGAKLYQARTGQKYYFANSVIEILHTYDDLMPFFVRSDNTNHTNILFSIELEGQKIMVTGDLTNKGFLVAANRYGEYLKSDILQVSHHGNGDGSNDTTFYAFVDADVVLVPGGGVRAAQKWAADNAKEVYYRSNGTKTLALPYKVTEGTK